MAPEPLKLSSISLGWPGKNSCLDEAITARICKGSITHTPKHWPYAEGSDAPGRAAFCLVRRLAVSGMCLCQERNLKVLNQSGNVSATDTLTITRCSVALQLLSASLDALGREEENDVLVKQLSGSSRIMLDRS